MESQPQNPEFKKNPENFHPCALLALDFDSAHMPKNYVAT